MGDHLYAASCLGVMYAFDPETGKIHWQYNVSADSARSFHGQPLIIDSVIFAGTDQGRNRRHGTLYAFDRFSGTLRWKLAADPGLPSDLCVRDSLLYMTSYAGAVMAVNHYTGGLVWRAGGKDSAGVADDDTLGRIFARPAFAPVVIDDRLFVVGRDSSIICLDAVTGVVVWTRKFTAKTTSQPMWIDTLLVFGTDACEMIYLRYRDGTEIRRDSLPVMPYLTMARSDSLILFLGDDGKEKPRDLTGMNLHTGRTVWRKSMDDPDAETYWNVPRVHVYGNCIFVGSTTGAVMAYYIADGSPVWSIKVQGSVRSIGHGSGLLYVGTMAGRLYAVKAPF